MRTIRSLRILVAASAVLGACSTANTPRAEDAVHGSADSTSITSASPPVTINKRCKATEFGGTRPVTVRVPTMYKCGVPSPLLVVLHGYTGTGEGTAEYFGIQEEAEKQGYLSIAPNGTTDGAGNQFWNATSACCDFRQTQVDDSAYLSTLIADVSAEWNVDRKRVFVIGHSNGGFMAYRMACEHSEQIAAIASLAGAMRTDAAMCVPNQPVSVVQIHGTADQTILYGGGQTVSPYPSAHQSVATWEELNGCNSEPDVSSTLLDLDSSLPGDDTEVTSYPACAPGTAVELWTINDGLHTPPLTPDFAATVMRYFEAHPKP